MRKLLTKGKAILAPMSLMLILLLSSGYASAQCTTTIDDGCVGFCGVYDEINYTVPNVTPTPLPITLCITVDDYSLCPTHKAGFKLIINGVAVKKALFTPGFNESFTVNPGDVIKIRAGVREIPGSTLNCPWLGVVEFSLNR